MRNIQGVSERIRGEMITLARPSFEPGKALTLSSIEGRIYSVSLCLATISLNTSIKAVEFVARMH
ncbi:MAG: hypothetical protein ACE5JA_00825 [bacterium]